MSKVEKREDISKRVAIILNKLTAINVEELVDGAHLTKDVGMDDVFAVLFMLECDKEFKCHLPDTYFVPSEAVGSDEMWRQKTYKELIDFLVDTIDTESK